MAPQFILDLSKYDLTSDMYGVDEIEKVNPHRGNMRLLDGILYESDDHEQCVAYKDIRDDEFWVAGHIPGRPIFPGVLMIEAAAQLSSFLSLRKLGNEAFMGFAGVENVKFRGQVEPGQRFLLLGQVTDFRRRRSISVCQGLVDGNLVFEATVKGMPM